MANDGDTDSPPDDDEDSVSHPARNVASAASAMALKMGERCLFIASLSWRNEAAGCRCRRHYWVITALADSDAEFVAELPAAETVTICSTAFDDPESPPKKDAVYVTDEPEALDSDP